MAFSVRFSVIVWMVLNTFRCITRVGISVITLFLLLLLWLAEIRAQLVEQLKCLDQQCELRVQLLQDLQDFFRKKAEIEMDYSRNLEKLAERFLAKTRYTKDPQFK